MCSIEMSACVTYECHMQAHKSRWFVAGQQCISSAFATGMLQSCTSPSIWRMDSGLVPDWHRATVFVYDDLIYTHEINHLSGIDMAIGIIYE